MRPLLNSSTFIEYFKNLQNLPTFQHEGLSTPPPSSCIPYLSLYRVLDLNDNVIPSLKLHVFPFLETLNVKGNPDIIIEGESMCFNLKYIHR